MLGRHSPPPWLPPTHRPRPTRSRSITATSAAGPSSASRRRDDDHLSLVAGITARQRKALVARELDTVERLAAAPIPFDPPLDGTSAASSSASASRRASRSRAAGSPNRSRAATAQAGEPIEPERGLALLPAPDEGDLFLDLEGDPYALDDGVDYLFGVIDVDERFAGIWSFDPNEPSDVTLAGEKRASNG